jgi:hypothetical protein
MNFTKTCLTLVASLAAATTLVAAKHEANQHKHMYSKSIKVLSTEEIANRSNDNYAMNNHGIVTAEKAAAWITD